VSEATPAADDLSVLESSALRALPGPSLAALAAEATVVELRPGQLLAREGDPAEAMYVVRTGRVELRLHQRQLELPTATLGPHDLLGWSWFVEPNRWTVDVVAPSGATLLRLPRSTLVGLADRDPSTARVLAEVLVGVLSRRLRDARVQMLDLFGSSASEEDPS
jgi:CRP-like cAMP-binding protein